MDSFRPPSSAASKVRSLTALASVGWILGLSAGCAGERVREVVARFRPDYELVRVDLARTVAQFETATVGKLNKTLREPPRWIEGDAESDTAILMLVGDVFFESALELPSEIPYLALDPAVAPSERPPLDLGLSGDLGVALAWTREPTSLAKHVLEDPATPSMLETLEAGLAVRYLCVVRYERVNPPIAGGQGGPEGGTAVVRVALFDRKHSAPLGVLECSARPDALIPATSEGNRREEALRYAYSTLVRNLTDSLLRTLAEATGGTFQRSE